VGLTIQNTRILQRAFIALFLFSKILLYIRYIYMKYELKVPTSLNEITLGQYQQYLKLPDGLTENQIALKMVNIFCQVPDTVVRNIKAADIQRIVETLTKMFNETPELTRQFKLGGKKYGFIPNLDNMSFGEYIDIDTYLGDWDNIEKAMAVLYRPIQGKYDKLYNIEPYEAKDALEYKFMPLGVVLGSIVFFYNLGSELCQVMMDYLHLEEMTYQQKQTLEQSMVGINQYGDWLTEILSDLKISLN
jgi:hypothetical protein